MKNLFLLFGVLLIFAACKKSGIAPYSSQGVILGIDRSMCPNCGGIEISIKNDPTTNPPAFYRVNSSVSTPIDLGAEPQFPINVSLDWKRDTSVHGGYYIVVTRIKLLN